MKKATSSQCLCRKWKELSWLTCFWKVTSRLSLTRHWDSKKIRTNSQTFGDIWYMNGWRKLFCTLKRDRLNLKWSKADYDIRIICDFNPLVSSVPWRAQFDRNWPSRMLTSWSGKSHLKAPGNKVSVGVNFSDSDSVWSFLDTFVSSRMYPCS